MKGKQAKRSGGVDGPQGHQRGTSDRYGNFVGENALRGPESPEVVVGQWEFLTASKLWSRTEMAEYIEGFLRENRLLRSAVDIPALNRLVVCCMLIQRHELRLAELRKPIRRRKGDDATVAKRKQRVADQEIVEVSEQLMKTYEATYRTLTWLDISTARKAGPVSDVNEDEIKKFE